MLTDIQDKVASWSAPEPQSDIHEVMSNTAIPADGEDRKTTDTAADPYARENSTRHGLDERAHGNVVSTSSSAGSLRTRHRNRSRANRRRQNSRHRGPSQRATKQLLASNASRHNGVNSSLGCSGTNSYSNTDNRGGDDRTHANYAVNKASKDDECAPTPTPSEYAKQQQQPHRSPSASQISCNTAERNGLSRSSTLGTQLPRLKHPQPAAPPAYSSSRNAFYRGRNASRKRSSSNKNNTSRNRSVHNRNSSNGHGFTRSGSTHEAGRSSRGSSAHGRGNLSARSATSRSISASSLGAQSRNSGVTAAVRRAKRNVGGGAANNTLPPSRQRRNRGASRNRTRSKNSSQLAEHHLQLFLDQLIETEAMARVTLEQSWRRECSDHTTAHHDLVLSLTHARVEQLHARQLEMQHTLSAVQANGLPLSMFADSPESCDSSDAAGHKDNFLSRVAHLLHQKMTSAAATEVSELRSSQTVLQERLDARTQELAACQVEVDTLRKKLTATVARNEIYNEEARKEVRIALMRARMDVDNMKKELCHRVNVACSSLRTTRHSAAVEAVQEMTSAVSMDVQENHDTLCKLILSIGAKDMFACDESGTMHSNFPVVYRDCVRRLDKDALLNLLDVLSFQKGVVDAVGKTLYVLNELPPSRDDDTQKKV